MAHSNFAIIPTQVKLFIKSWTILNQLIAQTDKPTILLSDQQIQEAWNGPYHHLFRSHISAFAKIARLRFFLTIEKDDAFKDHLDSDLFPKQDIKNITLEALHNQQTQLDGLFKQHYLAWQAQMELWANTLITRLQKRNISLSEHTTQVRDSLAELWIRFQRINKEDSESFEPIKGLYKYWYLKIYLSLYDMIYSPENPKSMGRIKKLMKFLKKDFNQLIQQEQSLASEQQEAIKTVMN